MMNFEIGYPVVGATRFREAGNEQNQLIAAETYLSPLYPALFDAAKSLNIPPERLPMLLQWWSAQTGPFSADGGKWLFSPHDGLLEIVAFIRDSGTLKNYDVARARQPDGLPARPMSEFIDALIQLLEGSAQSSNEIEVEEF